MSTRRSVRRLVGSAGAVLAVVAALVLVPGSGPSAAPGAPGSAAAGSLHDKLDTILADHALSGSQYSLDVLDVDTGRTIYAVNQNLRLLPASNLKMYTSAAALDVLGPSYRFTTKVLTSGHRSGHALIGNVYLKGYGDPTLNAADYDSLAASLAKSGVTKVYGDLVADDTYFDSQRLAGFWSWDDEPYYYSAQTDALSIVPNTDLDTGTVLVDIAPGKHAGDPARVTTIPANHYLHIVNHAVTGAASADATADAVRDSEHASNDIDVTGVVPLGGDPVEAQTTVEEPQGLVADVFRSALARHGVSVTGARTRFAATPAKVSTVVTHRSITLAQLLTPFLKLSNNMHAEVLAKTLGAVTTGHPGSWDDGTAAILADAKKNGVDTAQLELNDGSGLGRADYLTTEQTVTLLRALRGKSWYPTWYAALPIAGNPDRLGGGTLRHRMIGTRAANNFHGKTGSLSGVSALSGYLTDAHGHHLIMSMMTNNYVDGDITAIEDTVAVALADYGATTSSRLVTPSRRSTPAPHGRDGLECAWDKTC